MYDSAVLLPRYQSATPALKSERITILADPCMYGHAWRSPRETPLLLDAMPAPNLPERPDNQNPRMLAPQQGDHGGVIFSTHTHTHKSPRIISRGHQRLGGEGGAERRRRSSWERGSTYVKAHRHYDNIAS